MPDALAGVRIEREERVGEQVVAGTVCAVEIGRGGSGGDEDESTLYIDCHARPVVGTARVGPGVLRPSVVAELAGTRNGVERPAQPSCSDVVGADVSVRRGQSFGRPATDDVQILVDDARRRQAYGLPLRISAQIVMKIDAAAAPEIGEWLAGREIERVDVAAERGQQSLFFAVSPVGEAANSSALSRIPRPSGLSRRAIERDDAAHRRDGVENAVDDDGLGLKACVRREVAGIPLPRFAQLADVTAIDLRQR